MGELNEMQPIFVLVILNSASSVPLRKEKTPSWVNICGGIYLFAEDLKSWDDAYGQCELYDAHLWQIDNLVRHLQMSPFAADFGALCFHWTNMEGDTHTERYKLEVK